MHERFIYKFYLFYLMGIQVTIKEVDEHAFRELKAAAVKYKMTVGSAFNLAIENWLWSTRKTKSDLKDLKPVSWGRGTERLSEQVDEIVYGD